MPNQRADGQVVTSLAMDADLLAQVQARAAADGVKSSEVMRQAIEQYVGAARSGAGVGGQA